MPSTLSVPITSYIPLLRQFLFQFLDRLEEVAEFFGADENLIGAESQKLRLFLFQTVLNFSPSDGS